MNPKEALKDEDDVGANPGNPTISHLIVKRKKRGAEAGGERNASQKKKERKVHQEKNRTLR